MSRTAVLLLLFVTAGCSPLAAGLSANPPAEVEDRVPLHESEETLPLHLATSRQAVAPLILYTTGDTGWRDHDEALFRTLSRWGHPVAGISAPEFVNHLGSTEPGPGSDHVAGDFAAIVDRAERKLGLPPATPLVLVGISRGAGLAVAVASAPVLGDRLQGILAIALTREEENVTTAPDGDDGDPVPFPTYGILPSLGPVRVAVIQSTHDEYVTAAQARQLFGPDTATRRLRAIDSRNHGFDGAHAALEREMKRSFDWILQHPSRPPSPPCGRHAPAGPCARAKGREALLLSGKASHTPTQREPCHAGGAWPCRRSRWPDARTSPAPAASS